MDGGDSQSSETAMSMSLGSESVSLEEKDRLLGLESMNRHHGLPRARWECPYAVLLSILTISHVILIALLVQLLQSRHATAEPMHRQQGLPIPFGGFPLIEPSPNWLPPETWRTEIFHRKPVYGLKPNDAAQEAWRALIPKGKGFVIVKNETWLPNLPGLSHPNMKAEQQACVAVFHQLHCLYMTYTAYWEARAGNIEETPPEHLVHCWDYLRQSIMCAGDTTLEWVSEYSHPPNATNGWGFQHTCKNFDAIYDWTEQHRSKEDK
ncbi:hypothetical protein C2857_004655 [Epichloe festucae Fl1]|uniref:Oxidase ustYa n=1 Tax=Epichloe festucae (strain Fl1) TaxID=877507 RepID=A0A7U3SN88_EPIFF|nr:hypothetical protein C2857_004655 [Epichloe festucae Fl1]